MCLQTNYKTFLRRLVIPLAFAATLRGQTTSPNASTTFGDVYALSGTPSDLLLDENRKLIYMVNNAANRLDVFDLGTKKVSKSIAVGSAPSAVAQSMDGRFLYVTNTGGSSLSVLDANSLALFQTIALPAKPEGVGVGSDGRVLITTQGSGTNNALNTLVLYDPVQASGQQISIVSMPTPPVTPAPLPQLFTGRPTVAYPGRIVRTADGAFLMGLVATNQNANNAATTTFIYEVASGTILRNRNTHGQSTTLSISPDGSRFMAGFTLYDTATLAVTAQMNAANLPFYNGGTALAAFNVARNIGGSAFSKEGDTIYLTANTNTGTSTRSVSNILYVASSNNLGVRLGLKLKESIIGRIVSTADGQEGYALSETGLLYLPFGKIFDLPIIQPETTTVFLTQDNCNRGISKAQVRVSNLGKGRLTYTVSNTSTALVADVTTGNVPSTITFTMDSGRAGVARLPGTNLFTNAAGGGGTPFAVTVSSNEAVNIPNIVKVFMNFRQTDMRGVILPIPTALNNNQSLWDTLLDERRGRLYVSNSGYNRIEVIDTRNQVVLNPIEVGQLPHAMAMTPDGATLYVGNSGGESVSLVDLETLKVTGSLAFPPLPRSSQSQSQPMSPVALAYSANGLQLMMSNGANATFWRESNGVAVPRAANNVTPASLTLPVSMSSSPLGEFVLVMSGNNNASTYLYDAFADTFTASKQVYEQAPVSYFGPTSAAPSGSYFLANGLILSSSLAILGGTERPGATQNTFIQVGPFGFNQQTVVSNGQRNVAAIATVDENNYLRMTTPVRQNLNSTTKDDARTIIESVNIQTGGLSEVAIGPDSPQQNVFGNTRLNIPSRQMAIDSTFNAYAITLSGVSIMPVDVKGPQPTPTVPDGIKGVINTNDNTNVLRPGAFITINGTDMGADSVATSLTPPTVLGGTCVTLNDQPLPLLSVTGTQITAQIPENALPGTAVLQVRSLARSANSDPILITIKK